LNALTNFKTLHIIITTSSFIKITTFQIGKNGTVMNFTLQLNPAQYPTLWCCVYCVWSSLPRQ